MKTFKLLAEENKLRPFTDKDHDSYAGTHSKSPKIGNNEHSTVIHDGNITQVDHYHQGEDHNSGNPHIYVKHHYNSDVARESAKKILNSKKHLTHKDFLNRGYEYLGKQFGDKS